MEEVAAIPTRSASGNKEDRDVDDASLLEDAIIALRWFGNFEDNVGIGS